MGNNQINLIDVEIYWPAFFEYQKDKCSQKGVQSLKNNFTFYKERPFNNHALNNHYWAFDFGWIIVIKCWHIMPLITHETITWIWKKNQINGKFSKVGLIHGIWYYVTKSWHMNRKIRKICYVFKRFLTQTKWSNDSQ